MGADHLFSHTRGDNMEPTDKTKRDKKPRKSSVEENPTHQEESPIAQTSSPLQEECQEAPQGSGSSARPKQVTTVLRHVVSAMNRM